MTVKRRIFTHHPRVSLDHFTFCWWRHNRLAMTSQWPGNCDANTWQVISNSLDIDYIHGDIHGRSCKNLISSPLVSVSVSVWVSVWVWVWVWGLGPGSWVLGPGSLVLGPWSWVLGPGAGAGAGSYLISSYLILSYLILSCVRQCHHDVTKLWLRWRHTQNNTSFRIVALARLNDGKSVHILIEFYLMAWKTV